MKKIYTFAIALLFGALIQAQTVVTFDDLTLQPDSFWNGSDLSGGFSLQGAYFVNYYDTSYGGYWSGGFAYSNMVDSVTAGYTNGYSVMAGYAYSGNNFAIANPGTFNTTYIKFDSLMQVEGLYVTNSTYAYISMRDGDYFAKKFGGTSGDDPDWFKLTIFGYNEGNLTDSVEFYLADYRFSDNSQDYILKDWQFVSLTTLGNLDSLVFGLSSSDVGSYGMNTPAFFCMDNMTFSVTGETVIDDLQAVSVYPNPFSDRITIDSDEKINHITILNVNGNIIKQINSNDVGNISINVSDLSSGIYFINIVTDKHSYIRRLVK
ncbi:MAG TPA: DUF4465 domain-containing protein [Bacteroidales bacterium]|nr:DUF4465 domain-containing protein [Bacteroidales bacterium]